MVIKFGPSGLGAVKDAVRHLEEFSELGLRACEIAFTYGVYIKDEKDMNEIRGASEKFGIKLSIHAPYWINLNSKDGKKIEDSKKRILKCCEVGEKLGAYRVVFHAGFYSGMDADETFLNIKKGVLEMMEVIGKKGWDIKLAVEVMGKVNVFGSVDEIARLVDETGCEFCIDFAHVLAREKEIDWDKINKLFRKHKKWHCHFSGIEYGDKGERKHVGTSSEGWSRLLEDLPSGKEIVVINESPSPVEDSVEGLRISRK